LLDYSENFFLYLLGKGAEEMDDKEFECELHTVDVPDSRIC
jgi:hypothetical protein